MTPQRGRISFAGQMLLLQIGVIALVVAIGLAFAAWVMEEEVTSQYGDRALALARATASDPAIADAAARDDPDGLIQSRAERIRLRTGALFVVVTDRKGLRLSHPNPALVGKPVSTDPSAALSGHEVVNVDRGTLGESIRAKVPLVDTTGTIVGEVSVGFQITDTRRRLLANIDLVALFAAGALLLGAGASALLARRLRRQTLGLEPYELAILVQDREAVLCGIDEGVLAVSPQGTVTLCNEEASRLLDLPDATGASVDTLKLPLRLHAVLRERRAINRVVTIANDRVLVVNYRCVYYAGRDLGGVLTLRDRTDLETLIRERDGVIAVANALRAQRHEFANRIHTISGLLQINHIEEARQYVQTLSDDTGNVADSAHEGIQDPYLRALLAVKTAEASDNGSQLTIHKDSMVGRITSAVEVTTVVGNLVDNAIEAARLGSRRPAWLLVSLIADKDALVIEVIDSGDGVPDELAGQIFVEGVSTRGDQRGLGLALARHVAHSRGGRVRLVSPCGPNHGAIFVARIPGVVEVHGELAAAALTIDRGGQD